MTDEQIKKALLDYTNWPGSPEKLWQNIITELEPKIPWWKKYQIWLTPMAAAIVLLILVFNSPVPNQPEEQIEPDVAPENMIMMRTFFIAEQIAEIQIAPLNNIQRGAPIDLAINLTALQDLNLTRLALTARLIKLDNDYQVITEQEFNPWSEQTLANGQVLTTKIGLAPVQESGDYLIEIEIQGLHNQEPIVINQQQMIEIN